MTEHQTSIGRRSFLKASALVGGGLMISFSWLNSFASKKEIFDDANELTELNGFLKIAENGKVIIM